MKQQRFAPAIIGALIFASTSVVAEHKHPETSAPIGIMGEHDHEKNGVMFSYRYMNMEMDGNRSGTKDLSPEEIATTIPNRLAGTLGQPPTLRVVPTKMTMEMHMFGAMYAPTDHITLMLMVNYIEKEMDHVTFMGGAGTTRLGTFKTKSSGFGDTKVSGLLNIYDNGRHKVHLSMGISLPTGSITEKDRVLTPMGARPELRLPYPMQLGSGTYDLLPGVTYQSIIGRWNWGAQYAATIRTGENDENYTLGDEHKVSGWGGYFWGHGFSSTLRLTYINVDNIDGSDPKVTAPVQTADPDNQGKEQWDLSAGISWQNHTGHRLGLEVGAPIYQDLDGVQLETDWTVTAGYQYVF